MSAPRILLVDDQRQVIRMLRSSLEFSGRDYTVIDVPSGEEALLELARSAVDVVVTDLRLPGMSGLELLSRARQLNPEARAILLTGQSTEDIQYQAQALGVVAFLRKPLSTSYFLEAVERAVELAGTFGSPVEVLEEEKPGLSGLLEGVRRSVGARAALLLALEGEIIIKAGDLGDLEVEPVIPSLTTIFSAGITSSTLLGSLLPSNLQHIDGETHQFYMLNIGVFYALVLVCEGRSKEGQLEAVRRHGELAANDLLAALSKMGVPEPSAPELAPQEAAEAAAPAAEGVAGPGESANLGLGAAVPVKADAADAFWQQAASEDKPPAGGGEVMTYDEARRRGILKGPPK
jgi:CheY-like chemotaxis protein